jgi:ribosomal-protein-alanine N-acetyltransferase
VTNRGNDVVVDVRPAQVDELRALIDGPAEFEARFGRPVEPGFSSFGGVLEHSLEAITTGGVPPEWYTHLFYDGPDDGAALIGIGGFKGPPADGAVEIGYEIAPALRGQGRAGAAAAALIETARGHGCTAVIAHTLAEDNPSTSVLRRLGFTRTATIEDPDEGPIWRWELPLTSVT